MIRFTPTDETKKYLFETCRAFRASVDENGDFTEDAFETLAHYVSETEKCQKEIAELERYNDKSKKQAYEKWRVETLTFNQQRYEESLKKEAEYRNIHKEISLWYPPSDLHEPLKRLSLSQLSSAIKREQLYQEYHNYDKWEKISMNEWYEDYLNEAKKRLSSLEESKQAMEKNQSEMMEYMELLKASLLPNK